MSEIAGSLSSLALQHRIRTGKILFVPVFDDFGDALFKLSAVNFEGISGGGSNTQKKQQQQTTKDPTVNITSSLLTHLGNAFDRMNSLETKDPNITSSSSATSTNTAKTQQQQSSSSTTNVPKLKPPKWIYSLISQAMHESQNENEFPGPMCIPLTRSNISQIGNPESNYLVCEKSDGLRAIMISVALTRLPKWIEVDPNTDSKYSSDFARDAPSLSLRDIAVLEGIYKKIIDNSAFTSFAHNAAAENAATKCNLMIGSGRIKLHESAEDLFWLEPFEEELGNNNNNDNKKSRPVLLRRIPNPEIPRHVTFFIDRSMGAAFLLIDELPIRNNLSVVIADGELLIPSSSNNQTNNQQQQQQYIFTTFDLFQIIRSNGIPEILKSETMSKRYQLLGEEFVFPLQKEIQQDFDSGKYRQKLLSLNIVRKEMFSMKEFPNLVRRLSKKQLSDINSNNENENNELPSLLGNLHQKPHEVVLFDNKTPNDGLIFTPDRFDLTPGSRNDQFKWKWPDCLSVDWVIKPCHSNNVPVFAPKPAWVSSSSSSSSSENQEQGEENPVFLDPPPTYCEMYWFFKKRAQRGNPKEKGDSLGHSFAGHGWFWNPQSFSLPQTQYLRSASASGNINTKQQQQQQQTRDIATEGGGIVVECSLMKLAASSMTQRLRVDSPGNSPSFAGVWKIERVRGDKTSANAATTVVSVLESVAENIGISELVEELIPNGKENLRNIVPLYHNVHLYFVPYEYLQLELLDVEEF